MLRRRGLSVSPRLVLPQSSVGGRCVTRSRARVLPDFDRRSSFVDAGWAEFWHRTGCGQPILGSCPERAGFDAASTQAERCVDAKCVLANAVWLYRQASSERIAVEQDGHRAGADIDPPDETKQAGCRGTIIIRSITTGDTARLRT